MPKFRLGRLFCLIVFAALVSGCVRVRLGVEIKPDGTGTTSGAMGMTAQTRALLAGEIPGDPIETLASTMSQSSVTDSELSVRNWTEGEYEWSEASWPFKDLDSLNQAIGRSDLFDEFSVTREQGLLRDRFVLDAELAPIDELGNGEYTDDPSIDPTSLLQFQFTIRLPGDVVETNGVHDGDAPGALVWTAAGHRSISVRAVSQSWNWINIGLLATGAGVICLGGLALVGGAAFTVLRVRMRRSP